MTGSIVVIAVSPEYTVVRGGYPCSFPMAIRNTSPRLLTSAPSRIALAVFKGALRFLHTCTKLAGAVLPQNHL